MNIKLPGFYLMNPNTKKFVAIDSHSGGYPYMVESLYKAEEFHTLDKALDYRNSFTSNDFEQSTQWKVVTLEVTTTDVGPVELSWEVVFNAGLVRHGHINLAFEVAASAGYPFMLWNDRIYAVDTRTEAVGAYVKLGNVIK